MYITLDDLKSFEKSQSDHEKREWIMPQFFVQDLQRIMLFSLIGDQYRFYPRWCRILRPKHIKSVVLISVNNLSEYEYQTKSKRFKKLSKLFLNEVFLYLYFVFLRLANLVLRQILKFFDKSIRRMRFLEEILSLICSICISYRLL